MKNGVFWVVTPCGSSKNRRFGGTWRLLHQGDKVPPKRRFLQEPHGVTTQKTPFFTDIPGRFQSKILCMIVDAPWYVPNIVI
jgi:hypothetical protein